MKRRWLYFFLAAALLIAACLCARYILLRLDDTPSLPEQAERRYVVILPHDTLGQTEQLCQALYDTADQLGVYVQIITVSNFDEQSNEIYRAIYSGFDGMIIMPIGQPDADQTSQVFDDLEAAMPCVMLLDRLDRENVSFCLASDDAIGEIAVQELLDAGFEDGDSLHIFIGSRADSRANDRATEFTRALERRGLHVTDTLSIDVNIISSDERIKEYIRENHVRYVFCADALSTIAAAKCASTDRYSKPSIIGCGFDEEHLEYFQSGSLYSLISIDYARMGVSALQRLNFYCQTGTLPADYDLCLRVYDEPHPKGQSYLWSDVKRLQSVQP